MRRLETDAPMAADAALDTEAGNMDDMKEWNNKDNDIVLRNNEWLK